MEKLGSSQLLAVRVSELLTALPGEFGRKPSSVLEID